MQRINLEVSLFVRNNVYENVEILKSSNENVLWFIINNIFDQPVLFGSVYIPPENSEYSSVDIFDVLESEIIKYTSETNCNVCLLGDFNAHTGTKSDFTRFNDYVCSSVQLENVNTVSLESLRIVTTHYNLDLSVNNYGNRLLQLCKSLELLFANGRLCKDQGTGVLTCKNSTAPVLISYVTDFEILPFDNMISDVHNALHVEIVCKLTGTNVYVESEEPSVLIKPVWDNNSYQSFNDSLNLETIVNLNVKLDIVDITTVNKDTINNLIEESNDIIIQAASVSGMLKDKKLSKNNCTTKIFNTIVPLL